MEGHVYVAEAPRSTKSALPGASCGRDKNRRIYILYHCTIQLTLIHSKENVFFFGWIFLNPFSRCNFFRCQSFEPQWLPCSRPHNLQALNPHCDLEDFPSFIPSESTMDLVTSGPASAGLSSFGFGGLGSPKQ